MQLYLDPLNLGIESEETGIGHFKDKVSILQSVSSISQGKASTVSRETIHRVSQSQEVTSGLGHLREEERKGGREGERDKPNESLENKFDDCS